METTIQSTAGSCKSVIMRELWTVVVVCVGCASHVEAPLPTSEPAETGRSCAHAVTACELGHCTAEIDNRCDTPVTCRFGIESMCQAGGETGPVDALTKPITQLAGTKRVIEAFTDCHQGAPVTTRPSSLECI